MKKRQEHRKVKSEKVVFTENIYGMIKKSLIDIEDITSSKDSPVRLVHLSSKTQPAHKNTHSDETVKPAFTVALSAMQ